jgi:hypothetical protein
MIAVLLLTLGQPAYACTYDVSAPTAKIDFWNCLNDSTVANEAAAAANEVAAVANAAAAAANAAAAATNAAEIAALDAEVAANTAEVAANTADIASVEAEVAANAADLAIVDAEVVTNTADIATVDAATAANTAAIAALEATVASLSTDVLALEDRVALLDCPEGFDSVNDGKLCVQVALNSAANIHHAIFTCRELGGRVCTHNDMQQACSVINPYSGAPNGWYGDHAREEPGGNTDDEFLTWNRDHCDANNDGPGFDGRNSLPYRCCL